eukprot:3855884-Amphidinium_carterae.2
MRSHIRSSIGVLASCLEARCCDKGTCKVLASLPLWRSPLLRGLPCCAASHCAALDDQVCQAAPTSGMCPSSQIGWGSGSGKHGPYSSVEMSGACVEGTCTSVRGDLKANLVRIVL